MVNICEITIVRIISEAVFPFHNRPNWDKCADFVAGGMDRWKELREGKTSDQLVDVLLNEIAGGAGEEAGGAEYFDPQVLL